MVFDLFPGNNSDDGVGLLRAIMKGHEERLRTASKPPLGRGIFPSNRILDRSAKSPRVHLDKHARRFALHARGAGPNKCLQSTFWTHIPPVVSHEELTVHEKNVGFDAAESMIESIEERPFVFVIIVSVDPNQGNRAGIARRPQDSAAQRAKV
jgi:hypothetical protein